MSQTLPATAIGDLSPSLPVERFSFGPDIDELFQRVEHLDGKAEIVDGGLFIMSPATFWHGWVATKIGALHQDWLAKTGSGIGVGDNLMFRCSLPHRRSFSPDAAFFIGSAAPMEPVANAPVFAVEIRSIEDYEPRAEQRLAAKRADYFASGTKVVWDVDLLSHDVVKVYRADSPDVSTVYRDDQTAEAEPALPGWTVKVRDILPADWEVVRIGPSSGDAPC